jgi:O-antigen/teichoic acid export membrane protein
MGFIGDSSKVLSGQILQRGLSLLLIPVTARLIGPDDYGIVQGALSIISIAAVSCSFSFEASIAVAHSKETAFLRGLGTILVGLLAGIILWGLAYLSRSHLARWFPQAVVDLVIYLLPVYVPIAIASISYQNLVAYIGKFGLMPIADLVSTVTGFAVLIGVYVALFKDYRCLVVSTMVALLSRLVIFIYGTRGHYRGIRQKALLKQIFNSIWTARNFAKYNLPSNLLNSSGTNLPTTLMAAFFPVSVVGLFSFARNIIFLPTTLSGQALGQVYYPKAAQMHREGKGLKDITWQTFVYGCQLAIYPAVLIAASASTILPVLFGAKWNGVASYCMLILPMVLFNAVQTQIGIGYVFSILNQQPKILIGNILLFIGRIVPMSFLLFLAPSPYLATLFHSVGGSISYAILLSWVFAAVSISQSRAYLTWLRYCAISAGCSLPVLLPLIYDSPVVAGSSIILSLLIFLVIVWYRFLSKDQRSIVIDFIGWRMLGKLN